MKTKRQQQLVDESITIIVEDITNSINNIKNAYKCIVKLPFKNENGDSVVHGDNMNIHVIVAYWVERANCGLKTISRVHRPNITQDEMAECPPLRQLIR